MAEAVVVLKPTKLYRAIKAYKPRDTEVLTLRKGDVVRIEREDNEYEGFAWCDSGGKYGWVPLDIIELIDDIRGSLKEDYSSRELAVNLRDVVKGYTIVSGWLWAKKVGTWEEGWVPLNCIKEIES
jgi:hypothetical protein